MTTYNTGNPIGSSSGKDLYDNAENLDVLVNDKSKLSHPDRLGVERKTWHGMEREFDADQSRRESEFDADQAYRENEFVDAQADKQQRFNLLLANSGYEYLADYAAGIEVTEYNQVLRDAAGGLWRAAATATLPYTTDGTGFPEGGAFVAVGDADIRNDLAAGVGAGKGGLLVRGSVIYVDTIADLQALPKSELVDGQQVQVISEGMLYTWHDNLEEFIPTNTPVSSSFPVIAEHPLANNPVLTGDDVTDRDAIQGVADPFIVIGDDGLYHMFFEVLYSGTGVDEDIGHAWSVDGLKWTYTQIVIAEDSHAAFPQVFKHNGDWYMLPGGGLYSIYKATNFPLTWQGINDAGIESLGSDPAVFRYKGRWYSFVTRAGKVQLVVATGGLLNSTWNLHPVNPVVDTGESIDPTNLHRMAGKVIVTDRAVIAPVQSAHSAYGAAAYWVMLTGLTPTTFSKSIQDSYVVQRSWNNNAWNGQGSHHVCFEDPSLGEIIAVDGLSMGSSASYSISIYTKNPNGRKCRVEVGTIGGLITAGPGTDNVGQITFLLSRNYAGFIDTHWAFSPTENCFIAPKKGRYLIISELRGYSATKEEVSIKLTLFNKTTSQDIDNATFEKPAIPNPTSVPNNFKTTTVVELEKGEKIDVRGEVVKGRAFIGCRLNITEI